MRTACVVLTYGALFTATLATVLLERGWHVPPRAPQFRQIRGTLQTVAAVSDNRAMLPASPSPTSPSPASPSPASPSPASPSPDDVALSGFNPAVQAWFRESFLGPTPAQKQAWPAIASGVNTLLLAPTGSGKTLAAFLVAIDQITFGDATSRPGVRVLYVSPLKALGVDVEKNLQVPLVGVQRVAERLGIPHRVPTVGVRSGDTPSKDRARLVRRPPDILITTPESLYLLLTSRARTILETVETIVVDEIHALAGTKRGSHLFVSLERLQRLRSDVLPAASRPLQRIGLSATQRPLREIARLLTGGEPTADPAAPPRPRPVAIIEAGKRRPFDLTIEVPLEDMTDLTRSRQQDQSQAALSADVSLIPLAVRQEFRPLESETTNVAGARELGRPTGAEAIEDPIASIWPAIHRRLVELIRQHRTTLIFTNARRLAERLAAAINDVAGEEIAAAHHGSISKDQRLEIEGRLKQGTLPAIVATSSLELGIDMGTVDLVVQVESPPSVAAGIQRIGRAGHRIDARSKGIVLPKFRGDLLACSAAVARMQQGDVEETHYPHNPLDVLAQQIVAMASLEPIAVEDVYATIRSAAPFFDLPRAAFDGVLDLLSGRYPSDEFAELRPRLTWDRLTGTLSPRKGTQRIAIANAGTIPDRGLYGVFLLGADGVGSRVGELDEEMVFELKIGDVFLLGASSWRVSEITSDRVIVNPAPGEPGKVPFWRGAGPGRPLEFGRAIGALTRTLRGLPRAAAHALLKNHHSLDEKAAKNLLAYLDAQAEATGEPPSDRTIVVESFVDDVGDWRVVILSPFGNRVHIPWAMAVAAELRRSTGKDVDLMWNDDGIVFRLPGSESPPSLTTLFPPSDQIEDRVLRELGTTALFAARFRENAARSLLLPRRQPGRRTPLWLQRRKSADLLTVAAKYERFPVLLETYRECLQDMFDLPGLKEILLQVEQRVIRIQSVDTKHPSPFAASLMFAYLGNFIYNGDAPLAERRAQTLALDQTQLRALLGDARLRDLLDPEVVAELSRELQRLDDEHSLRSEDGLHDLLMRLGDLRLDEIGARAGEGREHVRGWLTDLLAHRRIIKVRVAGEQRFVASEDAARYRDGLGVSLPDGLPAALLESVADPLGDLVSRYARTHTPFHVEAVAGRLGMGVVPVLEALQRLAAQDRVVEGEFLPRDVPERGVSGTLGTSEDARPVKKEWCSTDVLKTLKRRSLAKVRQQIEPVEPHVFGRFLVEWQGVTRPRRGLDGLLDVVEQLQGLPLAMSDLEREILPARLERYRPGDLDELCAAGEVTWRGVEDLAPRDGRIALHLTEQLSALAPQPVPAAEEDRLDRQVVELLGSRGAMFFDELLQVVGGFPNDVRDALWRRVWAGEITNDTLAPLRSLMGPTRTTTRKARPAGRAFRSRRTAQLPGTEGRWTLLVRPGTVRCTPTEGRTSLALQLIERYGIVTRELVASENVPGGFSALYPIFRAMEETGRVRRGYFIAGQGPAQFAAPGADDRLRELAGTDEAAVQVLAATDPANPYGAALRWPQEEGATSRPQRTPGALVILSGGLLVGTLSKTGQHLLTFLPTAEPDRSRLQKDLIAALVRKASLLDPVFLSKVDSRPVAESFLEEPLRLAGFQSMSSGYVSRG